MRKEDHGKLLAGPIVSSAWAKQSQQQLPTVCTDQKMTRQDKNASVTAPKKERSARSGRIRRSSYHPIETPANSLLTAQHLQFAMKPDGTKLRCDMTTNEPACSQRMSIIWSAVCPVAWQAGQDRWCRRRGHRFICRENSAKTKGFAGCQDGTPGCLVDSHAATDSSGRRTASGRKLRPPSSEASGRSSEVSRKRSRA